MVRVLGVLMLAVGIALLALPITAGEQATKPDTVQGKVSCKLDGTGSGCCIAKLEKAIAAVKGVKEARLDAKAGTATIVCEKDAKVSVLDIEKAVAGADKHNHGFKVIELKQSE